MTVTDKFGGRGHDYQVIDEMSNENGGMLVIATMIPDEREWIQWKGRTARQDRPGQFFVVLNLQDEILKKRPRIATALQRRSAAVAEGTSADDERALEALLEAAGDGIGEQLAGFAVEQARGKRLNEATERYYHEHPRAFDDDWPSLQHPLDPTLSAFLTEVRLPP